MEVTQLISLAEQNRMRMDTGTLELQVVWE